MQFCVFVAKFSLITFFKPKLDLLDLKKKRLAFYKNVASSMVYNTCLDTAYLYTIGFDIHLYSFQGVTASRLDVS